MIVKQAEELAAAMAASKGQPVQSDNDGVRIKLSLIHRIYDPLLFKRQSVMDTNYINVLYVQILIWDHNNFARVTLEPKYPF